MANGNKRLAVASLLMMLTAGVFMVHAESVDGTLNLGGGESIKYSFSGGTVSNKSESDGMRMYQYEVAEGASLKFSCSSPTEYPYIQLVDNRGLSDGKSMKSAGGRGKKNASLTYKVPAGITGCTVSFSHSDANGGVYVTCIVVPGSKASAQDEDELAGAAGSSGGDSGGTVSRSTEYVEKFNKKLKDDGQFKTGLIVGVIVLLLILFIAVKRNPRFGAKLGCILVGCLFFFLAARERAYFEKGVPAIATITDVKISTRLDSSYDDEGDPEYKSETSAVQTFTYTVDGKEYSGKKESSTSHTLHFKKGKLPQASTDEKFAAKERAKKGTTFVLRYMPDDPSDYTLAGENTPKVYFAIGCILIVIGLFVIRKKKIKPLPQSVRGGMQQGMMMGQGGQPYQTMQQQQFGQPQQFQQNMAGFGYGMMQCPYCGTQLAQGTRFCTGCGTQLM